MCCVCGVFHTDSEKFSHALSVLNVLLADRCALSLALPLRIGHYALIIRATEQTHRRRQVRLVGLSSVVFGIVLTGCFGDPGHEYRIGNNCETPIHVQLVNSSGDSVEDATLAPGESVTVNVLDASGVTAYTVDDMHGGPRIQFGILKYHATVSNDRCPSS